jgi:hypothetical protein
MIPPRFNIEMERLLAYRKAWKQSSLSELYIRYAYIVEEVNTFSRKRTNAVRIQDG